MTAEIADPASRGRRIELMTVLKRGFRRHCPRCGRGKLFAGYLTLRENCVECGLSFAGCRADDAPAYFTILVIGHIVVPGILFAEQLFQPPTFVQLAIWLPVTLFGTLALLPFVKGALVGAVWRSQH
jgi:uncharacterized protein (DUF983 family)